MTGSSTWPGTVSTPSCRTARRMAAHYRSLRRLLGSMIRRRQRGAGAARRTPPPAPPSLEGNLFGCGPGDFAGMTGVACQLQGSPPLLTACKPEVKNPLTDPRPAQISMMTGTTIGRRPVFCCSSLFTVRRMSWRIAPQSRPPSSGSFSRNCRTRSFASS